MRIVFANSAWVSAAERLILRGGGWQSVRLRVRYGLFIHAQAGPVLVDTGYTPEATTGEGRGRMLRLYGAGDRALLPRLIKAAKRRPLPVFRDGRACIDLTHVDDVVDAVVAALAAPREAEGQIYNVSGGEVLPVRRIADEACARAGIAVRWRRMPLWPAMLAAGAMEAVALALPGRPEPPVTRYGLGLFAYAQSLDLAKARRLLGWAPKIPFEQGLDRTFAGRGLA